MKQKGVDFCDAVTDDMFGIIRHGYSMGPQLAERGTILASIWINLMFFRLVKDYSKAFVLFSSCSSQ